MKWIRSGIGLLFALSIHPLFAENHAPVLEPKEQPILKESATLPTPRLVIECAKGPVTSMVLSLDGKYLMTTSYDDFSIRSWEVGTGKRLSFVRMEHRPSHVVMSEDGKSVTTSDVYLHVIKWPWENGMIGVPMGVLEEAGNSHAQSKDGEWIATARYLQAPVRIWNSKTGAELQKLKGTEKVRKGVFSPNNKIFAATMGSTLFLWDTATWNSKSLVIPKVDPNADVGGIQFSQDGTLLGISFMDSSLVVVEVSGCRVRHNFFVRDSSAWDIQFSPGGDFFATAHHDGNIHFWNQKSGKSMGILKSHGAAVRALAFNAAGTLMVSAGEDCKVVFWSHGAPEVPRVVKEKEPELSLPKATATPLVPVIPLVRKGEAAVLPVAPNPKLTAKAFQVDGVMGEVVTLNGNILVEVGKTFIFSYEGRTYQLKLLSLKENQLEIQNGQEVITVSF